MARIKPGTLGSLVPLWTQTQPSTSRAPRVERKERSTLPQDILAWVQLSEAIGKDEGLIGSVASRIQRKWRESELADKRQEQRDQQEAEEHKRRLAAAHAEAGTPKAMWDDEFQSQLMHDRAQQMMGTTIGLETAPSLYPERGGFVDPVQPSAAPVAEIAAAPGAPATTTPGFPVGPVDVPGRSVEPTHDEMLADIRESRGAAGPTPTKVFTMSELMGLAYDARSGEEYRVITRQLQDVMETDPAMGGGSLAGIIFGADPKKQIAARRDLMKSFLEGQKHRRISDDYLALQRHVKSIRGMSMLDLEKANIESMIVGRAARASAQRAIAGSKNLSSYSKRLIDDWGNFYAGELRPWMEGKEKSQISAGLRKRNKGNDSLFFRAMNDVTRDAMEAAKPLTSEQRMELRAIRTAQGRSQRTIEELKVKAGTLKAIVDEPHYKRQLRKSLENLFQYQRDYAALAERFDIDTSMIADVAEQYRDELKALGGSTPRPKKPKAAAPPVDERTAE